jgi:hypothetical protein
MGRVKEPGKVEQGGVEVVDVHLVLRDLLAEFVGGAIPVARTQHTASSVILPHAVRIDPVGHRLRGVGVRAQMLGKSGSG